MSGTGRSAYRGGVVTCAFCGTVAESEAPPLTWTSATERGAVQWYCDDCSRTHLRAMESKLDSEWW
jgi:hypothetical protein